MLKLVRVRPQFRMKAFVPYDTRTKRDFSLQLSKKTKTNQIQNRFFNFKKYMYTIITLRGWETVEKQNTQIK